MPAHVVQCGAKGCVRGVLLPPGLDEQWLLSVAHTEADLAIALEVFTRFLEAVAEPSRVEDAYW
jgi:glutamate-1-semialdehyde aminotransferase